MSLKQEIEVWVQAIKHYDGNEYDEALRQFDRIGDTSKILFNIGVIHATLGEHEKAVVAFQKAVKLDNYFAVAYFQQGVSNFLLGDFEEALANFNDSLLYLRGNTLIDYEQLGLKFRLYSCEVLFNRGLCYIYLNQREAGMQDWGYSVKEKQVDDHSVIDEAIRDGGEGYTVFSIPVGVLYRPSDAKVRNVKTKDYLGKARLVAATDANNTFTGFSGTESKRVVEPVDDRPTESLSFAASNLVIPNKTSKRNEEAPDSNVNIPRGPERQIFPPTPPPEKDPGSNRLRDNGAAFPVKQPPSRQTSKRDAGRERRRRDEMGYVPEEERDEEEPQQPSGRRGSARSDRSYQSSRQRPAPQSSRGGGGGRRRDDHPEDEEYYDDVYDYYGSEHSGRSGNSRRPSEGSRREPRRQPPPQQYNDDYQSDGDEDFDDDEEFDLVSARGSKRGGNRRPLEVRKINVKVHYEEETRLTVITPGIGFNEFTYKLKTKLGMDRACKFKVRDEDGEQILVADQEDLDLQLSACKRAAKRAKSETGKLEIWAFEA